MSVTFVTPDQHGDVSRMAARLALHEEFQQDGMTIAAPRMVFSGSGSVRGRKSGLRARKRR